MSKSANKKYEFKLKNVNAEKIDQRYGIIISSNLSSYEEQAPKNTTKLTDLSLTKKVLDVVSFLDESKKIHKCSVSMIDFSRNMSFQEFYSREYDCFWCRNKIPTNVMAIGCPIKFIPSQAVKTYYSEISRDQYTIKENVTLRKLECAKKDNKLVVNDRDYYQTDGIFCSFNCCMAYIEDNRRNPLYNMSEMLLLKMYNDIYPDSTLVIECAPHWRKLKQCGGNLTINEFRDGFNKIEHKCHGIVINAPKFHSIGVLFEEKLKF